MSKNQIEKQENLTTKILEKKYNITNKDILEKLSPEAKKYVVGNGEGYESIQGKIKQLKINKNNFPKEEQEALFRQEGFRLSNYANVLFAGGWEKVKGKLAIWAGVPSLNEGTIESNLTIREKLIASIINEKPIDLNFEGNDFISQLDTEKKKIMGKYGQKVNDVVKGFKKITIQKLQQYSPENFSKFLDAIQTETAKITDESMNGFLKELDILYTTEQKINDFAETNKISFPPEKPAEKPEDGFKSLRKKEEQRIARKAAHTRKSLESVPEKQKEFSGIMGEFYTQVQNKESIESIRREECGEELGNKMIEVAKNSSYEQQMAGIPKNTPLDTLSTAGIRMDDKVSLDAKNPDIKKELERLGGKEKNLTTIEKEFSERKWMSESNGAGNLLVNGLKTLIDIDDATTGKLVNNIRIINTGAQSVQSNVLEFTARIKDTSKTIHVKYNGEDGSVAIQRSVVKSGNTGNEYFSHNKENNRETILTTMPKISDITKASKTISQSALLKEASSKDDYGIKYEKVLEKETLALLPKTGEKQKFEEVYNKDMMLQESFDAFGLQQAETITMIERPQMHSLMKILYETNENLTGDQRNILRNSLQKYKQQTEQLPIQNISSNNKEKFLVNEISLQKGVDKQSEEKRCEMLVNILQAFQKNTIQAGTTNHILDPEAFKIFVAHLSQSEQDTPQNDEYPTEYRGKMQNIADPLIADHETPELLRQAYA